jgi:hypothetical protein
LGTIAVLADQVFTWRGWFEPSSMQSFAGFFPPDPFYLFPQGCAYDLGDVLLAFSKEVEVFLRKSNTHYGHVLRICSGVIFYFFAIALLGSEG